MQSNQQLRNSTPADEQETRYFTQDELNSITRQRQEIYREINRIATCIDSDTAVVQTATEILDNAHENNVFRGRSITGVVSAGLYIAHRIHKQPIALAEIVTYSNLQKIDISRANSNLQEALNLPVPPTPAEEYIPRFTAQLNAQTPKTYTDEAMNMATDIVSETPTEKLTGKSPTGIAASALYACALLHKLNVTQSDISEVTGVTEVTIRKRYTELLEIADESENITLPRNRK